MLCWLCISIHLCNKNQLDVLFILGLFRQSTCTCFGYICSPSSGDILYIYNWYVLCFSVDSLLASRLARRQSTEILHQVGFYYTEQITVIRWNVLWQTAASKWLTASHSSECCWWLGRTKIKPLVLVLPPWRWGRSKSSKRRKPSHLDPAVCQRTFYSILSPRKFEDLNNKL